MLISKFNVCFPKNIGLQFPGCIVNLYGLLLQYSCLHMCCYVFAPRQLEVQ